MLLVVEPPKGTALHINAFFRIIAPALPGNRKTGRVPVFLCEPVCCIDRLRAQPKADITPQLLSTLFTIGQRLQFDPTVIAKQYSHL